MQQSTVARQSHDGPLNQHIVPEELLRDEEVSREGEERFAKEEEEARARARRRDEEDVQRKKRAVDVSPDL